MSRFPVATAIALAIAAMPDSARADVLRKVAAPTNAGSTPTLAGLPDGRALLSGGTKPGSGTALAIAEVFDPKTESWTAVAPMNAPRNGHSAVTLKTGQVLVAGGVVDTRLLSSSELYDPTTNTWTLVGSTSRGHRARLTLLADGRVAALIGEFSSSMAPSFELFDPTTKTWKVDAAPVHPHGDHFVAALPDGGVFVTSSAGTERWSPGGGFRALANSARSFASGSTLADGRIIVLGGASDSTPGTPFAFLPSTDAVQPLPGQARGPNSSTVQLTDGRVLFIGGFAKKPGETTNIEVFDPARSAVTIVAAPASPFGLHASVALPDAAALIVDGRTYSAYVVSPPKGCTSGAACKSGYCADGVCCDSACSGQCEACDIPGSVGTCVGVNGRPRGAREACSPPWIPACRALTCDAARSRTACVQPVFLPPCDCSRDDECPSGHCVDGVCCNTACDSQCAACDLPDARGVCTPVVGEPRGIRKGCAVPSESICSVQACNGIDPEKCVYVNGAETTCDSVCGGRQLRHCNGSGLCGRPEESTCPDSGCAVPSTEPPGSPRVVDALWVIVLGALIERARRARRR